MRFLRLDPTSRKVCFDVRLQGCCGDPVTELDRFTVDVIDAGCGTKKPLISYPMFEVNLDSQMCILLDPKMNDLCIGRYYLVVNLDGCEVDRIDFQWGGVPVIAAVSQEKSKAGDCFDETGMCAGDTSPLVDNICCDVCGDEVDPCDQKCSCYHECGDDCFDFINKGCCK